MPRFPAKWQMKALLEAIEDTRLKIADFTVAEGKYEVAFAHRRDEDVGFHAEFMDLHDPTGYSGATEGDYHVTLVPGAEAPRDQHHYISWDSVVKYFGEWLAYLEREFSAGEDWQAFVKLPRINPPVPPSEEGFERQEIEVIEPLLSEVEDEVIEVVEEEFATSEDLDELRYWVKAEFADIREEINRQSKRAFRRTAVGFSASVAMKFGPPVWEKVMPVLERFIRALDELPQLPA